MKPFDASGGTRHDDPQAVPRFELECLVDDIENPTQVMVVPFGTGDQPGSQWLTADIQHAVPFEWVR